MTALQLQALGVLRAAAAAMHGVVVRTSEALRAKQILQRFRRESGESELQKVHIHHSPTDPEHELWLIKEGDDNHA